MEGKLTRSSALPTAGAADSSGSSSETRLLARARRGSRPAAEALFWRYSTWLRLWVRGRLPLWVRGAIDTSDVVQDALQQTFARLETFESRRGSALRAYLRRSVDNRVRDELRRATRRQAASLPVPRRVETSDAGAPQLRRLLDSEAWQRYVEGLRRLEPRDRRLIVGRAELGYSYRQLAAVERMPSPDAARMALRRALVRLSEVFPRH